MSCSKLLNLLKSDRLHLLAGLHRAVGSGFPDSGGKNESSIHWDMLCDMSDAKIIVDNELFYENGKFVK